jgi:hypothetical protein
LQGKRLARGQAKAGGEGLAEPRGEGKGAIGEIIRSRCGKLGATAATRRPTIPIITTATQQGQWQQ